MRITKSDVIKIKISAYKRYCNIIDETNFRGTNVFDEECGLQYYINREEPKDTNPIGYFRFKVIDKRKLFLAKIKYGLMYQIWHKNF